MSTATPGDAPLPRQPFLRLAHFVRPWSWAMLVWYLAGFLPLGPSYVLWWFFLGLPTFLLGSAMISFSSAAHLRGRGSLCRWCAQEWPVDGAAQVERPRTAAQVASYHVWASLLVSVVFMLGSGGLALWGIQTLNSALFTAGLGILTVYTWVQGTSEAKHRDHGGWDDVGGPIGTPDPSMTKTA
jgi:hypothetical protein